MKKFISKALSSILLTFFSVTAFAWCHSVELGYGYSHDPNNTKYNNSGFLLSGDFYSFGYSSWTHWSLNGALGQWHSSAPVNKNVTSGAVSLALRLYPFNVSHYTPYLYGSAGPAVISNRRLGTNTQGSNLTIQTNLGFGAEFNPIDVNLRLVHYSNAGLASPNQGFNILYLLSVGYLF